MTNRETVLETLERRPNLCDDCLSRITGITPRQQVNTICRGLEDKGVVTRRRGRCSECASSKKRNTAVHDRYALQTEERSLIATSWSIHLGLA